jgi:hypothetical protein
MAILYYLRRVSEMPSASLRFTYAGYDIAEPLGETPQLVLFIKVKVAEISGGTSVYLTPLTCDIELVSVDSFSPRGCSLMGKLGIFQTDSPLLLGKGEENTTKLSIPITSPKIEKIIEIRRTNRLVSFEIKLSGFQFVCEGEGSYVKVIQPIPFTRLSKYTPDGGVSNYVVFSTEEISDIIKRLKHYQLVRFEIPVYKLDKPTNENVAKALALLQGASEKLEGNDIIGALKDIRDSLMNHLLGRVKGNEGYHNELRKDIVDGFLKNVPQEARDDYETFILKGIEGELDSLLQNVISKFIHLDSDKVERAPLHDDVELAYFVVLHTVRYLAKYMAR